MVIVEILEIIIDNKVQLQKRDIFCFYEISHSKCQKSVLKQLVQ